MKHFENESTEYDKKNGVTKYNRSGLLGNSIEMGNAHNVRLCKHYNGSGEEAFGGAKEWPHLEINLSFPVGRGVDRDRLAMQLMETIEEYLEARNL